MDSFELTNAIQTLARYQRMQERQPDSKALTGLIALQEAKIAYLRSLQGEGQPVKSYLHSQPGFPGLALLAPDDSYPFIVLPVRGLGTNDISPTLHPEIMEDGELADDGDYLRSIDLLELNHFEARELGNALLRRASEMEAAREKSLRRRPATIETGKG